MGKSVKQLLTDELQGKFTGVNEFLVLDITGVDGITNNELRGKLRDKGIKLTMVRNAVMRQAMKMLEQTAAMDLFTTGSCTVAYGGDSIVDLAKEIESISKKVSIQFKSAYVEGTALNADGAKGLAKMKNRVELQGEIIMLANSPGRRLASAIGSPAGIIAGCIKTIAEKEEKQAA
ncbi:MAG: 50S ribosomal protein L10 [Phycisphaerae bacterium]|jgi:large subunit ribosomal protein L10